MATDPMVLMVSVLIDQYDAIRRKTTVATDPMVLMVSVLIDQYDAMTDEEWRELSARMPAELRRRYVESVGRVLALMASVDLEGGVPDAG